MHDIVFHLKRAHLRTVAFAKALVREVKDMTPARFDLMLAVRQSSLKWGRPQSRMSAGSEFQHKLIAALDLDPSTISKMVSRLVELGWVRKFRAYPDRRFRIVALTRLGIRQLWDAMKIVYRDWKPMRTKFEALARRIFPSLHVLTGIAEISATIQSVARDFEDWSSFRYDVHDHDRTKAPRLTAEKRRDQRWQRRSLQARPINIDDPSLF